MIHTVKGFGIVSKAEVDVCLFVFFWNSLAFSMIHWIVGNLISGSSTFSKSNLIIWKFSVPGLLNLAWRILSITLLAYEMSAILWYLNWTLLPAPRDRQKQQMEPETWGKRPPGSEPSPPGAATSVLSVGRAWLLDGGRGGAGSAADPPGGGLSQAAVRRRDSGACWREEVLRAGTPQPRVVLGVQ